MPPPNPPTPPEEPRAALDREPLEEAIATARHDQRGGISITTLAIAAGASAVASFTVSQLWAPGTVVSAALTPVLVALASEFLRRPVDRVSASAARVAPGRRRPPSASRPVEAPTSRVDPAPERPAPPGADWAPVSYAQPARARWRPSWRVVLLTGLLAFAMVVGVITVPELLVGHAITGAGGSTTFISGAGPSPAARPAPPTTPSRTTTAPADPQPTTSTTTPARTDTAPQQTIPTTDATRGAPPASTTPSTSTPTSPAVPGVP